MPVGLAGVEVVVLHAKALINILTTLLVIVHLQLQLLVLRPFGRVCFLVQLSQRLGHVILIGVSLGLCLGLLRDLQMVLNFEGLVLRGLALDSDGDERHFVLPAVVVVASRFGWLLIVDGGRGHLFAGRVRRRAVLRMHLVRRGLRLHARL